MILRGKCVVVKRAGGLVLMCGRVCGGASTEAGRGMRY